MAISSFALLSRLSPTNAIIVTFIFFVLFYLYFEVMFEEVFDFMQSAMYGIAYSHVTSTLTYDPETEEESQIEYLTDVNDKLYLWTYWELINASVAPAYIEL